MVAASLALAAVACAYVPSKVGGAAGGSRAEEAARLPAVNEAIPRRPSRLARALVRTTLALELAVDRWRTEGNPSRGRSPLEVELLALYQQRIYRVLRRNVGIARRTIALLPPRFARDAGDTVAAGRKLTSIAPGVPTSFKTGPALPPGVLLRYYRTAERRFGVEWELLAAVNFVESAFGKIRSNSVAGAQGPMQFMPATWRAYGLGGNVRDPHDAILGAANYLHESGAPRDNAHALFHYNPSRSYVDSVLRYTRQIRRDARHFFMYYSWQVFVRGPAGDKRLTGPER